MTVFKVGQNTSEVEFILKRTGRKQETVPVDMEKGIYRTTIHPDGVILMSEWKGKNKGFIITEVIEKGESNEMEE